MRVLGRSQPGILSGHTLLDCEIVVVAEESLDASFVVTLFPEDLEGWEETLAELPVDGPSCADTRSSGWATAVAKCRSVR